MAEKAEKTFKQGLSRLEEIVEKMEKEEYELEEMIERFQEGIVLYKSLSGKLKDIELKISEVLENEEGEDIAT